MKSPPEAICFMAVVLLAISITVFGSKNDSSNQNIAPSEKESTDKLHRTSVSVDVETGRAMSTEKKTSEPKVANHAEGWTHSNQKNWSQSYPYCKGLKKRQSPINIETNTVILRKDLTLELIDYDQQVEFDIKNTHHTVSMAPIPSLANPSVKLNWLSDGHEFELQEVHFHWGNATNKGSEHEVDGKRAAAEMHMVHYRKGINKTDFGNVENSVVVVGVFIESIDKFDEPTLDSLIDNAKNSNGTDEEFLTKPMPLINLLPNSHHSFFTYNGSLTTPPCYEVVTWIVMREPVRLSPERLNSMMNIEANLPGGRKKINSNNREVQPLLDREVFASYSTIETNTIDENRRAHEASKFSKAFETYWSKVKISGSLKESLKAIESARKDLLHSIKKASESPDDKC